MVPEAAVRSRRRATARKRRRPARSPVKRRRLRRRGGQALAARDPAGIPAAAVRRAEERPTIFRAAPAHAPKAPDSAVPAAKMPPRNSGAKRDGQDGGRQRAYGADAAAMPSVPPADETAKAAPPRSAPRTRTDAGSSEAMPTPVAREQATMPEAAPAPAAEAAPGPQPLPEAKAANGRSATSQRTPRRTRYPP